MPGYGQIVNGSFDTLALGTSDPIPGWSVNSFNHQLMPIYAGGPGSMPYGITVPSVSGNNVLALDTGSYSSGFVVAQVTQDFLVNGAAPMFRIDLTLPSIGSDATGSGANLPNRDSFSVALNGDSLFTIEEGGFQLSPSSSLNVTLSDSLTAGFDKTVTADLSAFSGQTVQLLLQLGQVDDQKSLSLTVDNLAMTAVPEPLHSTIVALACCALVFRRRGLSRSCVQRISE
jgi:hypothetical protein